MKEIAVKLTGVVPLIQQSWHLIDPLGDHTKALKKISGKRKKTDKDHEDMAYIEYMANLYIDEKGRPILPRENILASIRDGAKKSRQGKVAEACVFLEESPLLQYDGPKDPEKLFKDQKFVLRHPVRVNAARIMRTRPMFRKWALDFTLSLDEEAANPEALLEWLVTAGRYVGVGTWRPMYGRFQVEAL